MAMAAFNVTEFLRDPSADIDTITNAKKAELLTIASHYSIPTRSYMNKQDIRNVIIEYLIQSELEDEEARTLIEIDPQVGTGVQLELEKIKLEREKLKQAGNLKEHEFLLQQSREASQQSREASQQSRDAKEHELQQSREARAHELKVLELKARSHVIHEDKKDEFDLAKNIKLVPPFNEFDPDNYFKFFEKTAAHLKWPKIQWTWLLQTKLVGKAANVYNNLEQTHDYDYVKEAILNSFSVTVEGYRQAFRYNNKSNVQTYAEFASDKMRSFDKWVKSAEVDDINGLKNLIVLEEFKRKIPHNVMLHLEDKQETDLFKAAQIADVYSLIHKNLPRERKRTSLDVKSTLEQNLGNPDKQNYNSERDIPSSPLFCTYCKKEGHNISKCKNPKCKSSGFSQSQFTKPVMQENVTSSAVKPKAMSNIVMTNAEEDLFRDFKSKGIVSLIEGGHEYNVNILRDTGAAQSLILRKALPQIEKNFTGEKVLLRDLSATPLVHLVKIFLNCPLLKGHVKIGVRDEDFPVPEVTLLLGNDLAGKLVTPNLLVTDKPMKENPTAKLEEQQPHLLPLCVVTRSRALNRSHQDESSTLRFDLNSQIMSKDKMIEAQQEDLSLSKLHHQAVPKNDVVKSSSPYYDNDGLLMRFYRPPHLNMLDSWAEKHQIVIPTSVCKSLLEIAHEGNSGHLGIHKTYSKLLNEFYWPGMKKDVTQFIKTCHTCQVVGKPNQTIPRAPLQPIQVSHEPFEKIVIDCVGPLPKTKKGNQYILTIMCPTTRFPEAFPLRNISAKTIANQLIKMFTIFGIPKEIQSDRGTNFTSDLFSSVLKELDIKQSLSSAYHPESQGSLERWHQTIKSMIKKYCFDSQLDWDEGLPFLLFAIRETPQESLGFSPFELLYGRQVRGPLRVVKDKWLQTSQSDSTQTVSQYLSKLKDILTKVRSLAKENLQKSQLAMKVHFDKKAKARKFNPGDLVLAYFPIPGSPLKAKFSGPYEILECLNNNNYILKTPDRRKSRQMVHSNLIKLYHQRNSKVDYRRSDLCNTVERIPEEDPIPSWSSIRNSSVILDAHQALDYLKPNEFNLINSHFNQFPIIFKDFPGSCHVMQHDVELMPNTTPVRQAPYRLLTVRHAPCRLITASVEAILQFPVPTTRKALMCFMGMAGFYRRFCPNFASVSAPLTSLTSGKVKFIWTTECQDAFEKLKMFLTGNPVLKSPDFTKPFHLQVDASDYGTGAVLLQEDPEDGIGHPVCYFSTKLKKHQLNYSTVEKELLGLILALQKFDCYLHGVHPLVVYTDHNPLVFLERSRSSNQRLLRWYLYLQPFNIQVKYIRGGDNVIADTLSRTYTTSSSPDPSLHGDLLNSASNELPMEGSSSTGEV